MPLQQSLGVEHAPPFSLQHTSETPLLAQLPLQQPPVVALHGLVSARQHDPIVHWPPQHCPGELQPCPFGAQQTSFVQGPLQQFEAVLHCEPKAAQQVEAEPQLSPQQSEALAQLAPLAPQQT